MKEIERVSEREGGKRREREGGRKRESVCVREREREREGGREGERDKEEERERKILFRMSEIFKRERGIKREFRKTERKRERYKN